MSTLPPRPLRISPTTLKPLVGLAAVVCLVAVVALCASMFRGSFADSVPITVLSPRAGLVMNPDAKVKLLGVQVGHVTAVDELPNGGAALHLAVDRSQLNLIPANIGVQIASTTVFGAKYVEMVLPDKASAQSLRPGQVLSARQVTVEINTLFEKLTSLLSSVEPGKLNATLASISTAIKGRGHQIGQAFEDLDAFLARVEPSLPVLEHELSVMPAVTAAFADAMPDLLATVSNATRLSNTVVERRTDLDAVLLSAAGLGDIGSEVIEANRQSATDVLRLLVPTTDLTNRYREGVYCAIASLIPFVESTPLPLPGLITTLGFSLGMERYRYPANLPKVAASGGPHCADIGLPDLRPETKPKFVVADIGADPTQYGNRGIIVNTDRLKQMLFGPIDGPPRNSAQIGQPG